MKPPRAVIFDLGGTLVHWPDWDEAAPMRWAASFDYLTRRRSQSGAALWFPTREAYIDSMREAELAHWRRVEAELWSGPPSGVIQDGFRRLGYHAAEDELLLALDGYARAVDGWAQVFPDSRETLAILGERGYRVGLLSNTWWAADWHNADLATHGLADLLDEVVYTSDLPHSKPHPSVFREIASRLGVDVEECVMVGDRPVDDVSGALAAGMRAVWKTGGVVTILPNNIEPTAVIDAVGELPALLQDWGGV